MRFFEPSGKLKRSSFWVSYFDSSDASELPVKTILNSQGRVKYVLSARKAAPI